ncbi:hypothetical protein A2U01_0084443, partial [Trifolium medium]|nr:hypothetical protein [Trifolium medium]
KPEKAMDRPKVSGSSQRKRASNEQPEGFWLQPEKASKLASARKSDRKRAEP